ncbi:MAG: hypothetical protein ACN4G0_04135 [Polyangiales bacterium]
MTRFVSTSLSIVATALMVTLSLGCGEGIGDETGSQSAELNKGQCNAIVATALSSAQRCARGECGVAECTDVGGALGAFFGDENCAGLFATGDANGLPGNASIHPQTGEIKHVGDVICGSIVACGLCPFAPPGACDGPCDDAE